MTRFFARHLQTVRESRRELPLVVAVLCLIPIFYLATLARGLVLGDPTEYTFVANILGIAHPPGYALITLLGFVFQHLVPVGSFPWRMHLLSATAGTAGALFVFGILVTLAGALGYPPRGRVRLLAAVPALFAALITAFAANYWQHAIHANPHIITAVFLAANLFFLTRWWRHQQSDNSKDRWLYVFSFSAGLGVTHHPLTVFSFPAYAIFILAVRPSIWRQWRVLARMLAFALLGLAFFLYYPIRSAMAPAFGPHDMNTLSGFLDHVLARGLTESLPFFSFSDLADRALVFWTLLRLQYSLPVIFLALFGLLYLFAGRINHKSTGLAPLALLIGFAFLTNYAFVTNLRQQDIMAYLLGLFLLIGLLSGIGLLGLLERLKALHLADARLLALLLGALFLLGPILQLVRNAPVISLRSYSEGDDYVSAVSAWFEGRGEQAMLLNDWEHMTPLWYSQFVEDQWPDPADVTPRLVATDRPWVESVFDFLPGGPVYLSGYRPQIVEAGFRLRPRDTFYQVVQPGDSSIPDELVPVVADRGSEVELVAYLLPERSVDAGDYVPLTLAMRSPGGTPDYHVPVLTLGDGGGNVLRFEFTTDSHLITPLWRPGEVIVERFDFALPFDLAAGEYDLQLNVRNLSEGLDTPTDLDLGQLNIGASASATATDSLLANFRQRVGLVSATARLGLLNRRSAPWDMPLEAAAGDTIHVTLEWKSLAAAEESYTVFLHLIDQANVPHLIHDYTPLGGSAPTHLWIPKWLPGQKMLDPYSLTIPNDLAPGTYYLEVGLYEMTGGRRLHLADPAGNLIGDRYILGPFAIGPQD